VSALEFLLSISGYRSLLSIFVCLVSDVFEFVVSQKLFFPALNLASRGSSAFLGKF
jgi:hypothetical protein